MYDRNGQGSTGLGLAIAIPSIAQAAGAVTSLLPSFLSSSDPKNDAARKARIDAAYNDALAGRANTTWQGQSYPAEQCLHDMAFDPPNAVCAVGSSLAKTYAKAKWNEYQARIAAGNVGGVLIGQSDIPAKTLNIAGQAIPPMALGIGALVLFLMLRRRR